MLLIPEDCAIIVLLSNKMKEGGNLPEPDSILETYYDHYKDTYEQSKDARQRRNKSFVLLCLLEAISFLLCIDPDLVIGFFNQAIKKELETTIIISNGIFQTLIWILIAYILVRYIQDTLYVEKQYLYLDGLEKKISVLLGNDGFFQREGKHYIESYPSVLNLIDLFYKTFMPFLFTVVNTIRIMIEWSNSNSFLCHLADSATCIVIIILTVSYYFHIHKKTTEWLERHISCFKWLKKSLHRILKEV